jgi:hypothetical protein
LTRSETRLTHRGIAKPRRIVLSRRGDGGRPDIVTRTASFFCPLPPPSALAYRASRPRPLPAAHRPAVKEAHQRAPERLFRRGTGRSGEGMAGPRSCPIMLPSTMLPRPETLSEYPPLLQIELHQGLTYQCTVNTNRQNSSVLRQYVPIFQYTGKSQYAKIPVY